MSWATITPTKDQVYTGIDDAINLDVDGITILTPSDLSGVAVNEIYLTRVKELVLQDLASCKILDINNSTDMDTINDIADQHEILFQNAIASLQRKFFFDRHNDGFDSRGYIRYKEADQQYKLYVSQFKSLESKFGARKYGTIKLVYG